MKAERIADVMHMVKRYGHWMSTAADHDHADRPQQYRIAIDQALETLEKIEAALKKLPLCSGISASWCPVHGDCTCKDPEDKNDDDCPLHSSSSNHGEVQDS